PGLFLAKALYDNIAETPDELAFRRGDVLTVLEQDTKGLEGWWLCSLRNKHGIAPGNRLKIVSGMGEAGGSSLDLTKSSMELYDQPNRGLQDYDVPPSHRGSFDTGYHDLSGRRSSNATSRGSAGSRKASLGDDLYDTPPSSKRGSAETVNGIYDTPPSSKRASSERTPPHSNRSSASRDSGSNLAFNNSSSHTSLNASANNTLVLPQIVKRRHSNSSDNCYETPPGSNRSSLERILSEEGPPIYESLSAANSTEHLTEEPTYDTPPVRNLSLSLANPASQSSLRSVGSSDSLLSNTSGVSSARLSQATSLPDSARSSMDYPSETYDVPPCLQDGEKSRKQLSMDSGLGFYDSPTKSRPSSINSNCMTPSTDTLRTSHSSFDCKSKSSPRDIKRSRSLEHALDDLYDTPKNNAPRITQKKLGSTGHSSSGAIMESSNVYDVPPQVMRDSVISMRSDSSDENQRFSSSSLEADQQLADVPIWDELLLDLDSALETLTKKQQDVSKATSRLGSFVNNTWRSRSSLEKSLYDIKVSCSLVRNALSEFVDFAQGARANALRVPDKLLASKLQKYISPLMSTLELVQKSFTNLEEIKWQVSVLCEPLDKSKPDDLGQIALVARELLPEVKKVASFIQNHSSVLFKKAVSGESKKSVASKPPMVPKPGETNGGKTPTPILNKQKSIQHRPLPAVPGVDRVSSTISSPTTGPVMLPKKMSSYDFKAALHKDDYAECEEIAPSKDSTNMDLLAEYDYVRLDTKDTLTKSQSNSSFIDSESKLVSKENINFSSEQENISKIDLEVNRMMNACKVGFDEIDTIPVKETSSSIKRSDVATNNVDSGKAPDSADNYDDNEFNDDLKTPVNKTSSSGESNFIMPSPGLDVSSNQPEFLDPNDRQVLVFYSEQINSHSTLLGNAIDAFLGVVNNGQPPNVFISHSKFVIVSAHKLVHIGDSIHRNLISNNASARIMHCANHLCDCLKASVTATKTAALKYPCAPAVQEMVDRVIEVSHAAHELKVVITQAAKQ
ncbi:enhancer of filamentation 1, partial [Biomphalaria pfeifferi]